jgi:exodeoxyribonuclease VII small subunit
MARTKQQPEQPRAESFEELFSALEERARKLEQGSLPLDQALKLCEEGSDLAGQLRTILEQAELRVTELRRRFDHAPAMAEDAEPYDGDFADFDEPDE